MKLLSSAILAAAALTLAACEGEVKPGGQDPTAPQNLTGRWELSVAPAGEAPRKGSLELGATTLKLDLVDVRIDFDASRGQAATVAYQRGQQLPAFATTRTDPALDLGILPLHAGGDWTFTDAKDSKRRCAMKVQASSFSSDCARTDMPIDVPSINGRLTGARTTTARSVFGELGGTWAFTNGGATSCSFVVVDRTIDGSCQDDGRNIAEIHLEFADGTVSGTSGSHELAARKL